MTHGRAIRIRAAGGPEVLEDVAITLPPPGAGELLVENRAVGVNFIDTYHRRGLYPRDYPAGIGQEAAGVVRAVGTEVSGFAPGDRVGWMGDAAYATHALVPATAAVRLDDAMDDESAAALMLKGMTAWMLAEGVRPVTPGATVLVLAAAGGVGSLLVPWLKSLGATVIAHAGSEPKADMARAAGADVALSDDWDALPAAVRAATDGQGADLVLDGVGAASWAASLASVARLGTIASYGNASGPVPPVLPLDLARAGSVFLTRPVLFDWIVDPDRRRRAWDRVCTLHRDGVIHAGVTQRLPLAQAAEAHRRLEARETTGATVLIP